MGKHLILIAAFFLLYWSGKTRNRLTKFSAYMLFLGILTQYIHYGGISENAPFIFAFTSMFAGFEPATSFRFKNMHKTSFAFMGIASAVYAVGSELELPFEIPLEFLLVPAPLLSYWLWKKHKRVVYQRVGFLVVWSAQAVVGLFYSQTIRGWLSELF